jgi:hypothetical protein
VSNVRKVLGEVEHADAFALSDAFGRGFRYERLFISHVGHYQKNASERVRSPKRVRSQKGGAFVRMSESKTSERILHGHDRQLQALALRKDGRDYRYIANQLEYAGPSGAYQAVMTALKETLREPAEEVRALELDRLDCMLAAIWPQALSGDLKAIDSTLRLMDRRARFLGLDAPVRVDIEGDIRLLAEQLGIDADEAIAEAQLILRERARG